MFREACQRVETVRDDTINVNPKTSQSSARTTTLIETSGLTLDSTRTTHTGGGVCNHLIDLLFSLNVP